MSQLAGYIDEPVNINLAFEEALKPTDTRRPCVTKDSGYCAVELGNCVSW
jgi:hypothetical protein